MFQNLGVISIIFSLVVRERDVKEDEAVTIRLSQPGDHHVGARGWGKQSPKGKSG